MEHKAIELEDPPTEWYACITEKHYDTALIRAVAAERKRCATTCEALSRAAGRLHPGTTMEGDCGDECAAAIRGPNV